MNFWRYTIPEVLQQNAANIPDKTAYIFDDVSYTWRDVERMSDAIALSLYRRGIRRGTHVGLWGVNSIAWVLYYFAVQKLGALAILLNYSYKAMEMSSVLAYNDVAFLLVGESKPDLDYRKTVDAIRPQLQALQAVWFMEEELAEAAETPVSAEEQALLRKQYVADVKRNLAAQLNNIDMVNPDGSVENLGDKYGKKTGLS